MTLSPKWWPWGGKARQPLGITISPSATPGTYLNEMDGSEVILIPAGNFLRGSAEGVVNADERPQRQIYLDAFYISRYPITNRQYRKFLEQTRHPTPPYWFKEEYNQDEQPVVGVTWHDAEAYCHWAGLRLPTEAEWEKAAGWDQEKKEKRRWPWGDTEPDPSRANFGGHVGRPTPVGNYPSGVSAYGCHDMAGNVWEWVQDWFDEEYYKSSPGKNPRGPSKGTMKTVRGGSLSAEAEDLRTAYRFWLEPGFVSFNVGFRCVRSA